MTGALLLIVAVLSWLEWRRFVRACEHANRTDWGRPWLNRLDGFNRIFCRRYHRLSDHGIKLPRSGPAIVAANHVSGLDPLLLLAAARRPLRFLIAREEYERWWLKWLLAAVGCIPVERAMNPRAAFREARAALERGEVVALFPHGRIVLDSERVPLKRGVAILARLSGAPVVPVRVEGVRGQGQTVAAVFLRSRARVRRHPALYYEENLLARLGERLAARH